MSGGRGQSTVVRPVREKPDREFSPAPARKGNAPFSAPTDGTFSFLLNSAQTLGFPPSFSSHPPADYSVLRSGHNSGEARKGLGPVGPSRTVNRSITNSFDHDHSDEGAGELRGEASKSHKPKSLGEKKKAKTSPILAHLSEPFLASQLNNIRHFPLNVLVTNLWENPRSETSNDSNQNCPRNEQGRHTSLDHFLAGSFHAQIHIQPPS